MPFPRKSREIFTSFITYYMTSSHLLSPPLSVLSPISACPYSYCSDCPPVIICWSLSKNILYLSSHYIRISGLISHINIFSLQKSLLNITNSPSPRPRNSNTRTTWLNYRPGRIKTSHTRSEVHHTLNMAISEIFSNM